MTICKQVSFFFNNLEGFKITLPVYVHLNPIYHS